MNYIRVQTHVCTKMTNVYENMLHVLKLTNDLGIFTGMKKKHVKDKVACG